MSRHFAIALAAGSEPVLVAQAEGAGSCPNRVFYTREVIGAFKSLECGDFCHLALDVGGDDVQFLVGPDAQDFTAEEGAIVKATVNHEQFANPFDSGDGGCLRTDVATSKRLLSETCPSEVFYTREVVGVFQGTRRGDFCHLVLDIDGYATHFFVGPDAQDFTAEEGSLVEATVNHEQFFNMFDHVGDGCLRTDVATSTRLAE